MAAAIPLNIPFGPQRLCIGGEWCALACVQTLALDAPADGSAPAPIARGVATGRVHGQVDSGRGI